MGGAATAVAVGVVALAGGLGISSRGERPAGSGAAEAVPSPAEKPPVAVTVAPVTLRPIQRTVEVVGTFRGLEEVVITPKVEGRVMKIHHDVGDTVAPGDLLLEIDPIDYQLAVEERSRELNSELAKLGRSKLPAEDFDVRQHLEEFPSLLRAKELKENAARRLERGKTLIATHALAGEEFEQLQTESSVAQATFLQAIMDIEATLASARYKNALLASARQRLKDTQILVPEPTLETSRIVGKLENVKYVVSQRMASEGEIVRPMFLVNVGGLFKLVSDKWLKFLGTVPERYVGEIRDPAADPQQPPQQVQIRVEAYPEKVFEGFISRVNPTVDPLSRTFQIEAAVRNESRQLKAGGFAKAAVLTRVDPQARTVPLDAVVTFIGSSRVFVAEGGKARVVPVTLGVTGRDTYKNADGKVVELRWVEVLGELDPHSQVITSGQSQLTEGTPVRTRPGERAQPPRQPPEGKP
jgi:multidrug efflux pump subunit AcrA (membrane-fusion protein)